MPAHLGGWTGLILVIIVLVLFAAPKLPQITKSVAQSMNIFKKEIRGNSTDAAENSADDTTPADEKNKKN